MALLVLPVFAALQILVAALLSVILVRAAGMSPTR
jgi:hypothetical protein